MPKQIRIILDSQSDSYHNEDKNYIAIINLLSIAKFPTPWEWSNNIAIENAVGRDHLLAFLKICLLGSFSFT